MDEVTQLLFGMDGFRVLSAVAGALDGELGVLVETVNPVRGCPSCGGSGRSSSGRWSASAMPPRPGGGWVDLAQASGQEDQASLIGEAGRVVDGRQPVGRCT